MGAQAGGHSFRLLYQAAGFEACCRGLRFGLLGVASLPHRAPIEFDLS